MMNRQAVAVAWAIHARGISPRAWKVLVVLAHKVNSRRGDWDVWPKQKTLADDCEMPLSTLKRQIDELEAAGLLVRFNRHRADGGIAGCTYRLNVIASFTVGNDRFDHAFASDEDDGEDDTPLAQNELGGMAHQRATPQPTSGLPPQPTSGLARTVEDSEQEKENIETDLFGEPVEAPRMTDDKIVDAFMAGWAKLADDVEAIRPMKRLGDTRRASLLARVSEYEPNRDPERVTALIARVLDTIRGSRFCRGEVKSFKADPAWALTPTYFPKLEETGYAQDAAPGARRPESDGDRSHVATGQKARDILNAGGGTPRRSARALAGMPPRGSPHAG